VFISKSRASVTILVPSAHGTLMKEMSVRGPRPAGVVPGNGGR
jgi:hypothetical protein